jgi:hypothetical protein
VSFELLFIHFPFTVFSTNHDNQIRRAGRILGVTLGFALLIFAGARLYPILHGPQITIKSLVNGAILNDPLLPLQGIARHAQDVVINGSPLATGPDGSFDDRVLLQPGYNVITMVAHDRFGTATTRNYVVMVHETNPETLTMNVPTPEHN